jgi:hypothetical protein
LEKITSNMRHAKIQNFRLVAWLVSEMSDFVFWEIWSKRGVARAKVRGMRFSKIVIKSWLFELLL